MNFYFIKAEHVTRPKFFPPSQPYQEVSIAVWHPVNFSEIFFTNFFCDAAKASSLCRLSISHTPCDTFLLFPYINTCRGGWRACQEVSLQLSKGIRATVSRGIALGVEVSMSNVVCLMSMSRGIDVFIKGSQGRGWGLKMSNFTK